MINYSKLKTNINIILYKLSFFLEIHDIYKYFNIYAYMQSFYIHLFIYTYVIMFVYTYIYTHSHIYVYTIVYTNLYTYL